jgi:hypothetical protein
MQKTIGILTYEQMYSARNIGSSAIRARSLLRHWPEAELFRMGSLYSAVIFQKAYWLEYALRFRGTKILDICDPDFLRWNSNSIEMARQCDALSASTPELATVVERYTGKRVVCVPDRIDYRLLGGRRPSHDGKGAATIAVWFGYRHNLPSLDSAIPALVDLGFKKLLVIQECSNHYQLPINYESRIEVEDHVWHAAVSHEIIRAADVAINFRLPSGRWRYKSNNKSLLAWALGVPVAHSDVELRRLATEEARIAEVGFRMRDIEERYDIRQSVEEYKKLIADLQTAGTAVGDNV